MVPVFPSPRSSLLLLAVLGMAMVSSGFPLPHLHPLESSRLSSPPLDQEVSKLSQWELLYPFFSLRDWSIQMMSPSEFAAPKPKPQLMVADPWVPVGQSQVDGLTEDAELDKNWPSDSSPRPANELKRNIVVADDAAFRQKSKLLTAMERQKWLNSYMQKLLVVNSR